MKKAKTTCITAVGCFAAFLLWTVLVCTVDIRPIAPDGSTVGLASFNAYVHRLTGVSITLYTVTDWLGLVPIFCAMGFAVFGLVQWMRRKSLLRVDADILILGGFYLAVIACYLFFESVVINVRPILINGIAETSYPSSTTLLVLCVMPTAMMQLHTRIRHTVSRRILLTVIGAFTVFMTVGRLLSGVHWITDIIGGILLSASLVLFYHAGCLLANRTYGSTLSQEDVASARRRTRS